MRRFWHLLFALCVTLGATGMGLRLPEPTAACCCGESAACEHEAPEGCGCGLPAQPGPRCPSGPSQGLVLAQVASPQEADAEACETRHEAAPWVGLPAFLPSHTPRAGSGSSLAPAREGPPPGAKARQARLQVFLI